MIEVKRERHVLKNLFQDYDWNYLVEAVLDGTMGVAWANGERDPQVGVVGYPYIRLFVLAGDPAHPAGKGFIAGIDETSALVLPSPGWVDLLKQSHPDGIVERTRYAFSSESLDVDRLKKLASQVPAGYDLVPMQLKEARQLANEKSRFSEDHFLNFDSIDQFIKKGFGFCMMKGGEIVCAATTFVVCKRGIEIQINTREEYRGKGLATATAAQLMLYSLEVGLDPSWDAANEISARLAVKLGYSRRGTYMMYVVVKD